MHVKNAFIKNLKTIKQIKASLEEITSLLKRFKAQNLPLTCPFRMQEFYDIEREVEIIKRLINAVEAGQLFRIEMTAKIPSDRILKEATASNVLIISSSKSGFLSKTTTFTAEGSFEDLKKFQNVIIDLEGTKSLANY